MSIAIKKEIKSTSDKISEALGGILLLTAFAFFLTITINSWGSDMTGILLTVSIIFGFRLFLIMLEDTLTKILTKGQ